MAGTIKAGAVFIEIAGKDASLQAAIQRSEKGLTRFDAVAKSIGGGRSMFKTIRDWSVILAAVPTIIQSYVVAPLKAAVGEFISFGDNFAKMSQRTGIGAHDLSLLGYAAEQCGSSIEDLGGGMRTFQKQMAAAMGGNHAAIQNFEKLGINFQKFQKLSKADQFKTVSEAISRIGDETLQANAAMKMFGRGGIKLLPLIQEGEAGIDALMKQGISLGVGISDEDAEKAVKLNDAMQDIRDSIRGLKNTIIASLADDLLKGMEAAKKCVVWIRQFVDKNQELVRTLANITKYTLAATGAFWAFRGLKMVFVPVLSALRPLGGLLLRLGPTVLSCLSPWGLLRLAVMGAIGAFTYFSGAGSSLLGWIGGFCNRIKNLFFGSFGDIVAMVQEGRISDAIQLMWLKIQLQFEQGKLWIVNSFNQMLAAVTEPFLAIYDTVSSVLAPLWQWVSDTASATANYLYGCWDQSMGWLGEMFGTWWEYILGGWDALQNDLGAVIVGTWWSIASAINDAIAWIQTQWNNLLTGLQTTWLEAGKWIAQKVGWLIAKISGLNANDVMADIERQYDMKIQGVQDRSAATREGIEAGRQGWQNYLDDLAAKSLDRENKAKATAPQSTARIDALKLEIEQLQGPVKDPKTEDFKSKADDVIDGVAKMGTLPSSSSQNSSAGTFSAFEIGALASRVDEDMLEQLRQINKKTGKEKVVNAVQRFA